MNKTIFSILIFCLAFVVGLTGLLTNQISYYKGQVDYLKANQNVMVWQMDKSCFDQIKNNSDGILRLQVGNKGEK